MITSASPHQEPGQPAFTRVRTTIRGAVVLAAVVMFAGITPASALAYWDFSGNLGAGSSYGEAQAGTSGFWGIRLSRANCDARMEKQNRYNDAWEQVSAPGGCTTLDWNHYYELFYYKASHGRNVGGSAVWVNIRIDASL
jgi:hypothetical protein